MNSLQSRSSSTWCLSCPCLEFEVLVDFSATTRLMKSLSTTRGQPQCKHIQVHPSKWMCTFYLSNFPRNSRQYDILWLPNSFDQKYNNFKVFSCKANFPKTLTLKQANPVFVVADFLSAGSLFANKYVMNLTGIQRSFPQYLKCKMSTGKYNPLM